MVQRYKLLVVDDEAGLTRILQGELQEAGAYDVDLAFDGVEAINCIQKTLYDVVVLDVHMPRVDGMEVLKFLREYSPSTQVIVLTKFADVKNAIQSMKLGACDFLGKPYDFDELLNTVERALERKRLFIDNTVMKSELSRKAGPSELIGESPLFKRVVESALKVAQSDSIVLIQGASGTGKELLANLIHKRGLRRERPFVAVNCASIPDTLLESELFGYEKGAFTNAYATKQGLVEVADGGTLFLDEVGDISLTIQPKLLRFLETGNFRRVGGINELNVDVRIISATNKDLLEEAKAGRFREDLLYRLNVVTIRLPLLRERKEDIPLLIDHFLKTKTKSKIPKQISPAAVEMLANYDWPGNVRELEHVLEGAVIMSPGDVLEPHDFLLAPRASTPTAQLTLVPTTTDSRDGELLSMDELEKHHIQKILRHFNGSRQKTAQTLGISQKTLYLKIKRYGLMVS